MDRLRLLFGIPEFPAILLANVILGMAYAFSLPFMSLFGTRELGLDPGEYGLFMIVNTLAGIAGGTFLARLSDTRLPRKAVMMGSTAFSVLGYLAYSHIRDVRVLLPVGALLFGLGGAAFSQIFAHVRDLLARHGVPPRDVPFYMNVFRLCFALAWTVGPALGALIVDRYSFRASFLAVAALQTLFILVVALGVRSAPPPGLGRPRGRSPLLTLHRVPGFLPHFIAMTLILACTTISMMNLPLLIVETLHGRPGQVGIAYSIAPFFELPLMWFIGIWAARIAPVRIIRYAAVVAVVFYGSLALVTEPWHIYPLQLLSAAMVAVTSGIAITFFQDFLPGQAGTATDLYGSASRIGAVSGYLLCGWVGSELGHRSVYAACALLCASAWLIMRHWRPAAAAVAVEGAVAAP